MKLGYTAVFSCQSLLLSTARCFSHWKSFLIDSNAVVPRILFACELEGLRYWGRGQGYATAFRTTA
jgi:hypothetical protein